MRISVLLAVITTLVAAALLAPGAAQAHGNLDQSLEGDPGCNTTNFAASVTANGGQRQQFIPTGTLLSSVGLCVSSNASNTPLVLTIYGPGGAVVGGGSTASNPSVPDSVGPPVRFVHVDFIAPFPVSPGAAHTIEISAGATITWYGTAAGSPYSYCLGAPNSSAVGDFGFQAYVADSVGSSPACPAPPTPTPVPATATAIPQPTQTPAPGSTATPPNTPAPGETVAPQPTAATGVTTDGGQPTTGAPAPGGGTAGNTSQPTSGGGQALPNAGSGQSSRTPHAWWLEAVAVLATGAALVVAGRRRRA